MSFWAQRSGMRVRHARIGIDKNIGGWCWLGCFRRLLLSLTRAIPVTFPARLTHAEVLFKQRDLELRPVWAPSERRQFAKPQKEKQKPAAFCGASSAN